MRAHVHECNCSYSWLIVAAPLPVCAFLAVAAAAAAAAQSAGDAAQPGPGALLAQHQQQQHPPILPPLLAVASNNAAAAAAAQGGAGDGQQHAQADAPLLTQADYWLPDEEGQPLLVGFHHRDWATMTGKWTVPMRRSTVKGTVLDRIWTVNFGHQTLFSSSMTHSCLSVSLLLLITDACAGDACSECRISRADACRPQESTLAILRRGEPGTRVHQCAPRTDSGLVLHTHLSLGAHQ